MFWLFLFLTFAPSVAPWCALGTAAARTAALAGALITSLTTTEWDNYDGYDDSYTTSSNSMMVVPGAAAAVGAGAFALLRSNRQFQERMWYLSKRNDGDNADRSYEFDVVIKDDNTQIPEYLLSGLLAGLYFLPPEDLLTTSSDVGRTMRYQSYRDLQPVWHEFAPPGESPFASHAYADVPRLTYNDTSLSPGSFRVYKFKLPPVPTTAALNAELVATIIGEAERCLGIAVSNAGGWHSTKEFFRNVAAVPAVDALAGAVVCAIRVPVLHPHISPSFLIPLSNPHFSPHISPHI